MNLRDNYMLCCLVFFASIGCPVLIAQIERPMVVIVPSYNNSKWYEQNLDSIYNQNYSNYQVIYIDDCSTDGTYELVGEYIKKRGLQRKMILIRNKKRKGALANHYKAVHMCKDNHIIVQLDGDDWFKHNDVLAKINAVYEDKNVWLTYGQFESSPVLKGALSKKVGQGIIKKRAYREHDWCTSHLRTFYAGLFKHIRLQDLLYDGEFFSCSCDMAMMFPMLEMAGGKIKFIDEVLYVYNRANTINVYKTKLQQQLHYQYLIRSKNKYAPLVNWVPYKEHKKEHSVGVFLFSCGNAQNIVQIIYSLQKNIKDIDTIYIFYNALESASHHKKLTAEFPNISIQLVNPINFKYALETTLFESSCDYVLLAKDTMAIKDHVNIKQCIEYMERTYAHGFDLSLGLDVNHSELLNRSLKQPHLLDFENGIHAWQYGNGEQEWRNPHNLQMNLYRKKDFINSCTNLRYDSPDSLEFAWQHENMDIWSIGLCFSSGKVINIK